MSSFRCLLPPLVKGKTEILGGKTTGYKRSCGRKTELLSRERSFSPPDKRGARWRKASNGFEVAEATRSCGGENLTEINLLPNGDFRRDVCGSSASSEAEAGVEEQQNQQSLCGGQKIECPPTGRSGAAVTHSSDSWSRRTGAARWPLSARLHTPPGCGICSVFISSMKTICPNHLPRRSQKTSG